MYWKLFSLYDELSCLIEVCWECNIQQIWRVNLVDNMAYETLIGNTALLSMYDWCMKTATCTVHDFRKIHYILCRM